MYHPMLLSLMMLLLLPKGEGQSFSDVKNLTDSLLGASYDKHIRPIINQNQPLKVDLSFIPFTLVALDETAQIASVSGTMITIWTDENLQWDPQQHNGITSLSVYTDKIWTPTVTLFNSADNSALLLDPLSIPRPISLTSNGTVTWNSEVTVVFTNTLNPLKFPYDIQNLSMTFVITGLEINAISLTAPSRTLYKLDLPFLSNNEWKLIRMVQFTQSFGFGSDLVIASITIQRRPTFSVLNLLFSTCALSLLNIFVFLLPADSGERITFTITALLAVMFFMSSTTTVLPQASENIPLVTRYLAILTGINCLTIVATIVVLQVHHMEEKSDRRKSIMHRVVRRFKNWIPFNKMAKTMPKERGGKMTSKQCFNTFATFKADQMNEPQTYHSQNCGQTEVVMTDMIEDIQSGDLSTGQTSLQNRSANKKKLLCVFDAAKVAPAVENVQHGFKGTRITPTDLPEKVVNSEDEQKDNPLKSSLNSSEDLLTNKTNTEASQDIFQVSQHWMSSLTKKQDSAPYPMKHRTASLQRDQDRDATSLLSPSGNTPITIAMNIQNLKASQTVAWHQDEMTDCDSKEQIPTNNNANKREKLFHSWQNCHNTDVRGKTPSSKTTSLFKQIGRHLDMIFFVVFLLTWSTVTIYYMVEIFTDDS